MYICRLKVDGGCWWAWDELCLLAWLLCGSAAGLEVDCWLSMLEATASSRMATGRQHRCDRVHRQIIIHSRVYTTQLFVGVRVCENFYFFRLSHHIDSSRQTLHWSAGRLRHHSKVAKVMRSRGKSSSGYSHSLVVNNKQIISIESQKSLPPPSTRKHFEFMNSDFLEGRRKLMYVCN